MQEETTPTTDDVATPADPATDSMPMGGEMPTPAEPAEGGEAPAEGGDAPAAM